MSYNLTATLSLKDNFSKKLRSVIKQTEQMRHTTRLTTAAVSSLGPALSATSAVGVAAVGGLASSFAAAGAGAGAFAIVATSAIGKVVEASEEVEKINERIAKADTAKERIKAQQELVALYDDMSVAQRGALKDLTQFKSFWDDFVKRFENPIFQSFGQGLQATQKIFEKLSPTTSNVSAVVLEMMTNFNRSLDGASANKFFAWLESNASESLFNFGRMASNTFAGVASLLQAFAPLGSSMEESLVGMTEKFKAWAASLEESKGFKDFVAFAQANGPTLVNILTNAATTVSNLVQGLAPLGAVVLKAAEGLTGFLAAVTSNKDAILGISVAVATFAGIIGTLKIISVITTLMSAWRAGTLAMTAASMGLNVALLASPVTWVVAGIAALVGILVLAYRKSETFRNGVNALWSGMKKLGSLLKDHFIKEFQRLKDLISTISEKFNAFKDMTAKFTIPNALKKAGELLAKVRGGSESSTNADGSHYHGLNYVPRNGYVANLHKGERVLTAKENREYSKGGRNNITINVNGMTIREEADIQKIASKLAREIYRAGEAGA